jgi:DNA ligase (NAD+)
MIQFSVDNFNNSDRILKLVEQLHFNVKESNIFSSKLSGLNFCITGKLNLFENRDALVADIESNGGTFVSSVSVKCNYLINNDVNSSSSKNKKAKQLGIPIITEEEYKNLLQ